MAINKVVVNGTTKLDLTDTTADTGDVSAGKVFYGADGQRKEGTLDNTVDTSMSDTSTNAVQNRIIKGYVDGAVSSEEAERIAADNTKEPLLPTAEKDRYLHTNASTGEKEWVELPTASVTWATVRKLLLDNWYKVGCYIQTDDSSFNPAEALGGTWARVTGTGDGVILRAAADNNTGGADSFVMTEAQLAQHNHGLWNETHKKYEVLYSNPLQNNSGDPNYALAFTEGELDLIVSETGSSAAISNLPAYQNCYTWMRTA